MKLTSHNELLLLLDLCLLLGCEDGGQLLLLGRVMLHAAGTEPEVRQVTPDMSCIVSEVRLTGRNLHMGAEPPDRFEKVAKIQ